MPCDVPCGRLPAVADGVPCVGVVEVPEVLEQVAWLRAQGVTQINIGPPLGLDKDRALRLTAQRILGRAR